MAYQQQHINIFILSHQCTLCSQRVKESMVYQFCHLTKEKQCVILFLKDSLDVGWIYPYSFQLRSALGTIVGCIWHQCLFPTGKSYGKILARKAAKQRAPARGTDSGMRTGWGTRGPFQPKAFSATELQYRPHPPGGGAQAPARTPTGGRAPLPPTRTGTEHWRSRKKTWETCWTYRNYTKEIPIQDNSRITKCTETTSGFGSPHTDDREAICLVPDLFLRHSLLAMFGHYTVLKQMSVLD